MFTFVYAVFCEKARVSSRSFVRRSRNSGTLCKVVC